RLPRRADGRTALPRRSPRLRAPPGATRRLPDHPRGRHLAGGQPMSVIVAPSILSADFAALGDAVRRVERAGAAWVHVDVMDGRFVPNSSIGVPVVASLKKVVTVPLDVHLMIVEPERYLDAFAEAGASALTVHAEATPHLQRCVARIRELGLRPGVAINPATPVSVLEDIAPEVGLVLVMSVNPGFGGQAYLPA